MKVAITDANIFIDLIYIGLCEELFEINLEIHTTIEVYDELNSKQQKFLDPYMANDFLTIHSEKEKNLTQTIQSKRNLSESDKSVLYLAIRLQAILLTGDNVLRKSSNQEKIEVHGIFWLLDKFLEQKLISKKAALKQLKHLMDYNSRLPLDECEKRISRWS